MGPLEALDVKGLAVDGVTWHASVPDAPVTVQVRSAGDAVTARLQPQEPGAILEAPTAPLSTALEEPLRGVACGQTAVVYVEDRVVCAGTITATSPAAPPDSASIGPVGRAPVV